MRVDIMPPTALPSAPEVIQQNKIYLQKVEESKGIQVKIPEPIKSTVNMQGQKLGQVINASA